MRPPRTQATLPIIQQDKNEAPTDLLVVFVDQTECRSLRWLKRGFRHCFVALNMEDRWVICDSLKNQLEFSLIAIPSSFDLGGFYRDRGYTVIAGSGHSRPMVDNTMIPEVMTCVTVVKRIIGIRSFWTFTPWQLFSLLVSMHDRWHLLR